MKFEHYSPTQLKKHLLKIFQKHLDLSHYKVFFFGSRVRGDNFARSDIDIGIEGPQKISAKIKLDIEEDLEKLPILYKIELVDFNNVSPKFKKGASQWTESLN